LALKTVLKKTGGNSMQGRQKNSGNIKSIAKLALAFAFVLSASSLNAQSTWQNPDNAQSGAAPTTLSQPSQSSASASSNSQQPLSSSEVYSENELINAGHSFFGQISGNFAKALEETFSRWGRPNGYILGEEASGAFGVGVRYGEGVLSTKTLGGGKRLFWQGPSFGWDVGADGSRVMILVYNLRDVQHLFQRFGGVNGSAYLVAGMSLTAYTATPPGDNRKGTEIVLVPVRSGIGARLGVNVGYLKITNKPTWNPL
jgi:hypothetical protein